MRCKWFFPVVFSKYLIGLQKKLRLLQHLFFHLQIPALELYVLVCLRRKSPSLYFGYFISANKGAVLLFFFSLQSRTQPDKQIYCTSNINQQPANEIGKEIFIYTLTTLIHQLCFYFTRFFSSFSDTWPI